MRILAKRLQPDSVFGRKPRSGIDRPRDRKSTRLNSSHGYISYAVFCSKKKRLCERRADLMSVPGFELAPRYRELLDRVFGEELEFVPPGVLLDGLQSPRDWAVLRREYA